MTSPLRPNSYAPQGGAVSPRRGCFPIPRKPLASQLRVLNDTFRAAIPPLLPGVSDESPRYVAVTNALYAAATAAYGPPAPSQPVPAVVRVQVANLQRYTMTHRDWASHTAHLVEVARLRGQIRAALDIILLEKDVGLAPLP